MSIYNSSLGILRIGNIINEAVESKRRIHICGVLGAGQRGIAELLLKKGFRVSGSDVNDGGGAEELISLGLEFRLGHSAKNVHGAALLVYTLAISEDNPEYLYARSHGIPTASRAEMAAYLSSSAERSIAVAGTHGKSTVTAMLAHIFDTAKADATVLSGARLMSGAFSQGTGEGTFILEACEYKDSFLKFTPSIAVINNVELDHTDYFRNIEAVKKSFLKYARRSRELVMINADDEGALSLCDKIGVPVLKYGSSSLCDYRIADVSVGGTECLFSVAAKGERLGEFCLHVPGIFNVSNAAAAISSAYECGIDTDVIRRGIESFRGIERRLEYIGLYKSRPVFYDYAHHPTEIYRGIAALRAMGFDSLTVIFKPHTYSRTLGLWDGFVRSLSYADYAIIGDIYGAREENQYKVSSEQLAAEIGDGAFYATDENVCEALDNFTRGAIAIMGAADMARILKYIEIKKQGTDGTWKTYL